ncbi:hypothetical protein [Congzhengia minquanensis]|uniref:Uncharacterized protein n=1 Tax=Congzhengia minquanensis TaxID=2763657 RepID=A0A926DKR3_9FIRM|nr:hypothetical protein [Congzhengia minquanensis]MBC8540076.1 hypothetical protein [Congzhengia minquanensis]
MGDGRVILFFTIAIILALIGVAFEKHQEKEKMRKKKEQAVEVKPEPVKEPVEIVQQPESPKVAALRSAARQSLQINLLALEAQRSMAEIARLHRTDTTTRRNPQSDPCYRRAEWTQNGDDWRQGRF